MANLKQTVMRFFEVFGLQVRLTSPRVREDLRLVSFLRHHDIQCIIDAGANDGGFARMMFKAGFKGKIISYEPLPDAHAKLLKQADGNPNWVIADRLALSDKKGAAQFNITNGDASSSLLPPSDTFVSQTSIVEVVEVIEVETNSLDAALKTYDLDLSKTLLKVDVQGGEAKLFEGAHEALKTLKGVLCEVSLLPLYEGQILWDGIHDLMEKTGLELWDIWPGYRFGETLRLSQVDNLYFRP